MGLRCRGCSGDNAIVLADDALACMAKDATRASNRASELPGGLVVLEFVLP